MSEILLEVKHVSKRYGQQVALRDVSFELASGKIIGLLGPNGWPTTREKFVLVATSRGKNLKN